MSFKHHKNIIPVMTRRFATTASITIAVGDLLAMEATGLCERAAANDASILGIAAEAKASSDAAETPILVHVIRSSDIILADATVTSPAQADVGEEIDIVDHASVDVGASSNDECIVYGLFGTATDKVLVHFNPDYLFMETGAI